MSERVHSANPMEEMYGYSRAVRRGDRILVAGTAAVPQDGSDVPFEAGEQMRLCGRIALDAITSLGGTARDIVRTRMFITDVDDAHEVALAHRELFGGSEPAATMVVVAGLLDPRWKVEIEVEALMDSTSAAGVVS